MTERVIHEVKFIETDDGFRIEIKGDKERLKQMGFGSDMPFGPGMGLGLGMMGMGPRMIFKRFRHGPHGRRWRRRFGPGFGPWSWWGQWFDEEDEDDTDEKPPQDA